MDDLGRSDRGGIRKCLGGLWDVLLYVDSPEPIFNFREPTFEIERERFLKDGGQKIKNEYWIDKSRFYIP
jgi:hypothetical protein